MPQQVRKTIQKGVVMETKAKRQRECPVCGKSFIPVGMHIYRIKHMYTCSYNCREKYRREHPKKKVNDITRW